MPTSKKGKPAPKLEKRLLSKIDDNRAVVAVMGMGYVGLPLGIEIINAGFEVFGFDPDNSRVSSLRKGNSYIIDVADETLKKALKTGRFKVTQDPAVIARSDIVVICVPTPLSRNKDLDLSAIVKATSLVRKSLRKGMLVILESTTYPGTTDELLKEALESKGMKAGRDFFLAMSPERVDPANAQFTTSNTSKILGGTSRACTRVAGAFLRKFVDNVIEVSSPRVAEMTKIFENTFRLVNIALVNEFAQICSRMGLDVYEVIDAAATKEFGFMPFYPGPGVGGHCIPLDPYYLSWKSKEFDLHPRFIELASEINENMPYYVVEKTARVLNEMGKPIKGTKILAIGVAYKKDVEDTRESPALKVIELLDQRGAHIALHDPFVPDLKVNRKKLKSSPLSGRLIERSDLVIILTDHSKVNYKLIAQKARVIIDTRNSLKSLKHYIKGKRVTL